MLLVTMAACSGSRNSQWDNLDYAAIARAHQARENDSGYRQPSIVSCVDDDLYNCR
jgi:hypothetical protein